MLHRIRFILPVFTLLTSLFTIHSAHASTIQPPQTGQTGCWDTAGTVISCAGTGRNGEKLTGVAPPVPRFTENGNGTITDNLTGLIWLQNANCFGGQTWDRALTCSKSLVSGSCGFSDGSAVGDWRLPSRRELYSLVDLQNNTPSLPTGHPFSNVVNSIYLSSSNYSASTLYAWGLYSGAIQGFQVGENSGCLHGTLCSTARRNSASGTTNCPQ